MKKGSSWNKEAYGVLTSSTARTVTISAKIGTKLTLKQLVDTSKSLKLNISANGSKITGATMSVAARGGIVNSATMFGGGSLLAGEDGQEAIIPLERNTEWADIVATQIAGKLAGGLSRALDSFGEMVTAGFAAMLEGLNSLMEQAAAMVPDLSDVQVPEIASRSEALHSTAQSYLPDRGADESWVDAVADRVAQRVSARSGSQSGGEITITVPVYLDGQKIGQSAVTYINGEARRTGVNPLASYL